MRRVLVLVLTVVAGTLLGATLALGRGPGSTPRTVATQEPLPTIEPVPANTDPMDLKLIQDGERRSLERPVVLAWTPGGLDASFIDRMRSRVPDMVVVKSGNAWMDSSRDADGSRVDRAPGGYAIPIETAVVDPQQYRRFVLPADRWMLDELEERDGDRVPGAILGATSARLRRLHPGGELDLGNETVKVIGVLPDEFVGAHELVVGSQTGARLGIDRDRYLLIDPGGLGRAKLSRRVQAASSRPVQVRFPGETPYLRHGDAVQPQVIIKERFGEFAARPTDGGELKMAPGFGAEIVSERVPLLGQVQCNRELLPQLIGAMKELRRRSLGRFIHSNDGCFSARFLNRDPGAGISHHAWGVAIDINAAENPFGASPVMDREVIDVMKRWGFTWGGDWIMPDGMHFEWIGPPRGRT